MSDILYNEPSSFVSTAWCIASGKSNSLISVIPSLKASCFFSFFSTAFSSPFLFFISSGSGSFCIHISFTFSQTQTSSPQSGQTVTSHAGSTHSPSAHSISPHSGSQQAGSSKRLDINSSISQSPSHSAGVISTGSTTGSVTGSSTGSTATGNCVGTKSNCPK